MAGRRLPDGLNDVVAVGVLEDVARGAGDEHLAHDALVLVPGQRHHADIGELPLEMPGGLDPVHLRHPDIHQDDIRMRLGREREHLFSARGLPHDLDLVRLEQGHEGLSELGIVVDKQNPDWARPGKGALGDHA